MKTQIYDWDTDIVYISDQLENFFPDFYRRLIDKFDKMRIDYDILQGTKDIWCRDYMPIHWRRVFSQAIIMIPTIYILKMSTMKSHIRK